jgi:tetrahydromethanopterin S-methyltransferase subunit G
MEAMRKSWTDERLDHFEEKVDRRFDEVDRRFGELDRRVEKGFDKAEIELHRINDRLDDLGKAMYYGAFTMTGGILACFAAMITLIVTRT